ANMVPTHMRRMARICVGGWGKRKWAGGVGLCSCVLGVLVCGQWVRVPRICVGMYAYAWVVSDGWVKG
ncbi:hypothetical protein PIB30_110363, partial [Stylosanthes scabra]|nr:hypothetical protein [Stylosanthes scabra]